MLAQTGVLLNISLLDQIVLDRLKYLLLEGLDAGIIG